MHSKNPQSKSNKRLPKGFLDQPLLTPPEAAAKLGLNKISLSNLRVKKKGPPFIRIGGRIRYPQHLLEEYLAQSFVDYGSERVA